MSSTAKDIATFAVNPIAGTARVLGREAKKAMTPDIDMPEAPEQKDTRPQQAMANNRARKRAASAYSRSDTLLTSPLGLPGENGGNQKTLLGR